VPSDDLSGDYPFVDGKTGGANTSFMEVDTELDKVCVAGQVRRTDDLSSASATVTFAYSSTGDISKDTDKKVKADFGAVTLTLDISGEDVTPYHQEITPQCKLKATLLKRGSADKVTLRCDLGENFSAFSDLNPLNPQYLTNIANAYVHQKRVTANLKSGRLSISHVGVPADGEVPASCTLPPT
jgi:hypothetical protein